MALVDNVSPSYRFADLLNLLEQPDPGPLRATERRLCVNRLVFERAMCLKRPLTQRGPLKLRVSLVASLKKKKKRPEGPQKTEAVAPEAGIHCFSSYLEQPGFSHG